MEDKDAPWLKNLNASVRGGLRDMIVQQSDGKRTILTPRPRVISTHRPPRSVPLGIVSGAIVLGGGIV